MKEMTVDVLAFTGHKALMGSTVSRSFGARKHLTIRQTRSGGTGLQTGLSVIIWEEYPWKTEFGTANILGIASSSAGLDWIEQRGIENICPHEYVPDQHVDPWHSRGIETEIRLYCCDGRKNNLPIFSMNIEGLDSGKGPESGLI